jgi:hypothetical protein
MRVWLCEGHAAVCSCQCQRCSHVATLLRASCRAQAFEATRDQAREKLLDSQCHFTSAVLLPSPHRAPVHVAMGTTLGHICILTLSQLFTGGHQRLSNVIAHRWKAHKGCVNSLCVGLLLLLQTVLSVLFTG